jgi:hypothetical protein
MHKKIILLIFLFLISLVHSQIKQNKSLSILIYSEGEGFLQPYIETTLKSLINTDSNKMYFRSVNSFNRFISDNKYQADLSDLIGTQRPENEKLSLYYSKSEKEIRKRIFNILKDYNYFLTVNTNTLGELIEFQFQLYETVNTGNNIPYNISDKVINVQNFFINPKEPSYKIEIKNAIQRLFKKSNKPPLPSISIFNNKIKNNDTIIVSKNTKIQIDASDSGDYDSEKIIYKWRNIPNSNEKYQTFNKLKFKDSLPFLNLNINKEGPFNIGFKVNDGINESKEITFTIITKKKPLKINIQDTYFFDIIRKPKWNEKSKSDFLHEVYIQDNDSASLFRGNIIYSNKLLGSKLLIEDINYVIDTLKLKFPKDNNQEKENKTIFKSRLSFSNYKKNKPLYIYNISSDSLLSIPTVIRHKVYDRDGFTFRFSQNISSLIHEDLQSIESANDTIKRGIANHIIKLGYFINHNIEIGIGFPLKRDNLIFNANEFLFPEAPVSIFSYYHLDLSIKFISFYGGLNLNLYNYRRSDEDNYDVFFGFSPEFGIRCSVLSSKYFDFKVFAGGKIDTFQNKKFKSLSGIYTAVFGFEIDI